MKTLEPLTFEADIDPSSFIRIPAKNTVIAKRQNHNNLKLADAVRASGERKFIKRNKSISK